MDITCIADLHGYYPQLEGGDLLIVAGDLTARDTEQEYVKFSKWLDTLCYRKVIVVAGNHDNYLIDCAKCFVRPLFYHPTYVEYLCDSGTEFEYIEPVRNLFDPYDKSLVYRKKLKIWGSPWTKTFEGMNPHCKAFTCETEEELAKKFKLIPDDVDILVTHSPPFTILDMTIKGEQAGSTALMAEHMTRLSPKLWVFGHIHENYGIDGKFSWNNTIYVNASHVNERYQPVNKPIRIEL